MSFGVFLIINRRIFVDFPYAEKPAYENTTYENVPVIVITFLFDCDGVLMPWTKIFLLISLMVHERCSAGAGAKEDWIRKSVLP
jgi:hypothetical protein